MSMDDVLRERGVDITELAAELRRMPDYELTLTGPQLLQVVGMLQVALTHPDIQPGGEADGTRRFIQAMIAQVRADFAGYPKAQAAIDEGNRRGVAGHAH